LENTEFFEGSAEALTWPESTFDVAMFTLSLHHMDFDIMPAAIDEAIRVLRPGGTVIFLEPMPVGTFFEAEMHFGCCDGDERRELAYAKYTMLNSERLTEIEEFIDQV
jgi:ubiquinone/menaquinone biosynthesis C-methylase UbiE